MKHFLPFLCAAIATFLFSNRSYAQWELVGPSTGFSEGASWTQKLLFHPSTNEPYVAFYDYDPNFYDVGNITVVRFDGTDWNYVGNRMFSKDNVTINDGIQDYGLNFSFDLTDNEPFVSFRRVRNSGTDGASIMYFDGSSWTLAGDVVVPDSEDNFGYSSAPFYAMDVNPVLGNVALVYPEPSNGKCSVLEWDGSDWGSLDVPGFTDYPSTYNDIGFDTAGVPYILHDGTMSGNLGVMRFDGGNWVDVGGDVSSSPANSRDNCLRLHPLTNEPYVAYINLNGSNGATIGVKRYDGTNWVLVGANQEAEIKANFPGNDAFTLKLHPTTGIPYLIYKDQDNTLKPVVKYFDGTNWVLLGSDPVTSFVDEGMGIAFHPQTGLPYAIVIDHLDRGQLYRYNGTWTTGIASAQRDELSVGPNPASDYIRIHNIDVQSYQLVDLIGRTVAKGKSLQVDVSNIPVGTYILLANTSNGLVLKEKIVVDRQ